GMLLAKTKGKPCLQGWLIQSWDERVVRKATEGNPERRECSVEIAVHLRSVGTINGMSRQIDPDTASPNHIDLRDSDKVANHPPCVQGDNSAGVWPAPCRFHRGTSHR